MCVLVNEIQRIINLPNVLGLTENICWAHRGNLSLRHAGLRKNFFSTGCGLEEIKDMLEITENFNANKIRKVKSKNTKNAEKQFKSDFYSYGVHVLLIKRRKKKQERKDFSSQ